MSRKHADFFARMLERLPETTLADGRRPLAALSTRDGSDPMLALLDAWAMVCENLSFYHDRIAEEGTLATASERALRLLAQQIGHDITPPLAATTWLAFTVQEEAGGQPTVRIPAGTRVDSLPEQERPPQPFETDIAIEARAVWNRLLPLRTPLLRPRALQAGDSELELAGLGLALRPGDRLLLRGERGALAPARVLSVHPEPQSGLTRVGFEPPLAEAPGALRVHPLRRRAGLHGRDAEEWLGLAREQRLALAQAAVAVRALRVVGTQIQARREDGLCRRLPDLGEVSAFPVPNLPADAPRRGHAGGLVCAARAPDGRWLTGGAEGLVLVHAGDSTTVIGRGEAVGAVAWDADGLTALSGHQDGVVQRWAVGAPDPLHPLDQWEPFPLTELVPDWPEPDLPPGQVELDTLAPELRVGEGVVLTRESPEGTVTAAALVVGAEVVVSATYGRVVRVSRLALDPAPPAGALERKTTDLWICGPSFALANAEVPRPDLAEGTRRIALESSPGPLPNGRPVLLRGLDPSGAPVALPLRLWDRSQGADYAVEVDPPLPCAVALEGLELLANAAPATHGETVEEVLGSGDGSRAHQQFRLGRIPAFVAATSRRGWRSTVEVRVDGLPWAEVESLSGAGPDDRVFSLSREADGRVRVRFGDGRCGARLPTRADNVTARYRMGGGPDGLVGADRLTLLRTHPLGVASATNPMPSQGGRAADPPERVRVQAPASVLTLDRLVSLNDYAHYAKGFAGVLASCAAPVETPVGPIVFLSVHSADAGAEPQLVDALERAIDEISDPAQNARVGACLRVPVALTLRVLGRGGAAPLSAAREALLDRFAMGKLQPSESISMDAVLDVVQRVPGVQAARVLRLARPGAPSAAVVEAAGALWHGRGPRPAEILSLDPESLDIEEEPA